MELADASGIGRNQQLQGSGQVLDLQGRLGAERIVQRIPHQRDGPRLQGIGEGEDLSQAELAGHEQGKELGRTGKGDEVRFESGAKGDGDPFVEHAFAPDLAKIA